MFAKNFKLNFTKTDPNCGWNIKIGRLNCMYIFFFSIKHVSEFDATTEIMILFNECNSYLVYDADRWWAEK